MQHHGTRRKIKLSFLTEKLLILDFFLTGISLLLLFLLTSARMVMGRRKSEMLVIHFYLFSTNIATVYLSQP